jgi:FAD:protein FMN transferase
LSQEPTRPPLSAKSIRWIVANIAVAAVVLIGLARTWHGGEQIERKPAGVSQPCQPLAHPSEVESGWFEEERAIYHEIPARLLFRLPEAERGRAAEIGCKAWSEFERLGVTFNAFSPNSELTRLNQKGGTECRAVSTDLFEVLQLSRLVWSKSDRRFDPTVFPLKELWRTAVASQKVPDQTAIQTVLSRVGFEKVQFCQAPRSVRFTASGVRLDFGGIAKGYAVDRVRHLLQNERVGSALVQLGGEIACFGSPMGERWRLGIQHPVETSELWGTIAQRDCLRVSTSGNYRQPLMIGNQAYYHIFDPTTGLPAADRVLGVTTVDPWCKVDNSVLDAAATATTVLGVNAGLELAGRLGIEALILSQGQGDRISEKASRGFTKFYERRDPSPAVSDTYSDKP